MRTGGLIFSGIFLLSLLWTGCAGKKPETAHGVITFVSGDVTVNNVKSEVGARIFRESTITTGMKSIAIIQFSDIAALTIKSNSTVKIEEIIRDKDMDVLRLSQSSGSTFNKIVKKGTDYQVKTPTIVASVRGTSFQLKSDEKSGSIMLLSGQLSVVKVKDGKADPASTVHLTEGKKVEVTGEKIGKTAELSGAEAMELKVYDRIALVKDVGKVSSELEKNREAAKEKLSEEAVPAEVKSDIIRMEGGRSGKGEEKKAMTLADLQKKFGTLSLIRTKDGKEYIGAFIQKGAVMEVTTVSGTININTANIQKISPYKL